MRRGRRSVDLFQRRRGRYRWGRRVYLCECAFRHREMRIERNSRFPTYRTRWPTGHARRRANSAWSRVPCSRRQRRAQTITTVLPRCLVLVFIQGSGTETVVIQSELPGSCFLEIKYEPPRTPPRFSFLVLSTGTYATNLVAHIRGNIPPCLCGECGVMASTYP